MFAVTREELSGQVHRYTLSESGRVLSYARVLDLWQHSETFRACFIDLLAGSPFSAYRWETPPIHRDCLGRRFGCVLVEDPGLDRPSDPEAFAEPLGRSPDGDVAAFENLGGDALLVVPARRAPAEVYVHLARFVRRAPVAQSQRLWQAVARAVQARLDVEPLWLNTAGDGVAWLHVRLDSRPKYYRYHPYTVPPPDGRQEQPG